MVGIAQTLERVNTVAYGAAMGAKAETRARAASARIGRGDWLHSAFAVLVREGIEGVRVEPLAARLDVTKGSFYWHFKDRAALHAAMLEHWRAAATRDIIAQVEQAGGTPRAKLRCLIAISVHGKGAARLETAMRGWAHQDAKVAEAIAAADRERIDYVSGLLRALGVKPAVADLRARILYLMVIGSYFSAAQSMAGGRDPWREIETLIT